MVLDETPFGGDLAADEGTIIVSGDAVVAVLDGGSDGPAEGQNEAPEKAMEPEAKDFDPEVFLSLSGHTSVAGPPGEVNGDGSPGPVAGPEVVAAELDASEPEVVQEIPVPVAEIPTTRVLGLWMKNRSSTAG